MLSITILCVGTCKERYWREACAEYVKRLGAFCRMTIIEVEEERLPEHPSAAQKESCLRAEGKRLLARVPAGAALWSLCIEGKALTSPDMAKRLEELAVGGISHVALAIGGSWGLSEEVKAASRLRLSMSAMTFPHQLARVMLLEQIYRAMQISAGGKYHK